MELHGGDARIGHDAGQYMCMIASALEFLERRMPTPFPHDFST